MTAGGKPRVLLISSHSQRGGSELYLRRLIAGLTDRITPTVVLLEDGPLASELRSAGLSPVIVPTGSRAGVVLGAFRIGRLLRQLRPDVVHANGVKAALMCALARARRTAPWLWVKHDHSYDGALARWTAKRADLVIGVSESVLEAVRASGRTTRIAPGVVASGDAARGREELGKVAPDARHVVLAVGRLDAAKGYADAIDALADVRHRLPRTHLVIAGGPEPTQPAYGPALSDRARAAGCDGQVHLLGHRHDVHDLVAAADVVVITSHAVDRRGMGREGFGLVAVEAMMLGTPVVAYADGAIPEVTGDCAVLVPPRDTAALSAALEAVLRDRAQQERMVRCGRDRSASFSLQAWCDRMLQAYRSLMPLEQA